MLNIANLRDLVVRPVLVHLDMWSPAAEQLVLATGVHESALSYLAQIGGGPALGLFQMEPTTHDNLWKNYLNPRRPDIGDKVRALMSPRPRLEQLATNLAYAAAMCRVHYWRRPERLPDANDAEGMGRYWKRHYNSRLGAGMVEGFAHDFKTYIQD